MTTAIKKIKKIYNKNIKETVVAAAAAMRKSEQPDFPPPPTLLVSLSKRYHQDQQNSHERGRDRSPEENKGRQLQQKPVDLPSAAAVIARRRHYLVSCATLKAAITRADICLKISTPESLSRSADSGALMLHESLFFFFTLKPSPLFVGTPTHQLHNGSLVGREGAERAGRLVSCCPCLLWRGHYMKNALGLRRTTRQSLGTSL